jgi:RNA polymerase sigma factor (sigma-70 family)
MEPDLAVLVSAASKGDRDAWNAIVARYAGLVWTVARSFRLSAADAADVSQATWLRLVEHLHTVYEPAGLGSWLATTSRREALAMLRKRREIPTSYPDRPDDRQAPPWQRLVTGERDEELWRAYERLPDRCRTLLRLLVIEPVASYAVAAAALDLPVGSLGPTRARCLETLRRHLGSSTVGEGGVDVT